MFKILFKLTYFAFLISLILVLGYTLGKAMWFEFKQWYFRLVSVFAILVFEFGCFASLENLWKLF